MTLTLHRNEAHLLLDLLRAQWGRLKDRNRNGRLTEAERVELSRVDALILVLEQHGGTR